MRVGRAAGLLEFLGCGIGATDPQVVGDRAMKKIGILVHHRDLVTDISKTQAFKVVTTDLHHARVGIIKTQQQPYDRRLTRTTWANKAHSLTSRHTETQTLVRSASSARIGKTHALKRHGGRKFLNRYRRFWLVDHRLGIHQLEDRLRGRLRQHTVMHQRTHIAQWPIDLDPEHQHHEQHTKAHLAINNPKGPKGKCHSHPKGDPGIGNTPGERVGREHPHCGFKQGVRGVFEFFGSGGALAKGLQRNQPLHRIQKLCSKGLVGFPALKAFLAVKVMENLRRDEREERSGQHDQRNGHIEKCHHGKNQKRGEDRDR